MEKLLKQEKVKKDKVPSNFSTKNKEFWSRVLVALQTLGKSLMYPIAILPFAALLNRFGALAMELNPMVDGVGNGGYWFGFIIGKPGAVVFDNIALFFAIGTAFGIAKDNRGEAALVGALFYIAISALLSEHGLPELFYKNQVTFQTADGKAFSELFYVPTYGPNPDPEIGDPIIVGAKYILNIGVLGGIVAGCSSAALYNKFRGIKLPLALSFFGGRRFVPMMVLVITIPTGILFGAIWPWIQYALVSFGSLAQNDSFAVPFAGIYGVINRFMQPFGLHHILNTFLWFQMPVENYLIDTNGHIILTSEMLGGVLEDWTNNPLALANWANEFIGPNLDISKGNPSFFTEANVGDYFVISWDKMINSNGTIIPGKTDGMAFVFGDINAFQKGMLSGNAQTGFFPMYWGGLTAAGGAMILAAKKENRKQTAAFLGGVALVAALTGIDEPIVFSFIFVGPILWVYNAIFTGIFATIAVAMHMHVGFGFSGGFIDYAISFANSWGMSKAEAFINGGAYGVLSNPLWMLVLAAVMAPLYFFSFYFTIKKMNILTPGREETNGGGAANIPTTESKQKGKKVDSTEKYATIAKSIVELVGQDNIEIVNNCTTRLRLTVTDNSVGTDEQYKELGAFGVKRLGKNGLQIIIGTDVEHVADIVHEITGK